MDVYENGIQNRYHLNGFTWEWVSEKPYTRMPPDERVDLLRKTLLMFRD